MWSSKSLEAAIRNRHVRFFRFDNSSYWQDYYQEKLKNKDTLREKKYSSFLRSFLHKDAKVLDAASGLGFLSVELKHAGLDVRAIDLFNKMMTEAKKYFLKNKTNIPIIKADVTQTPFKNNCFDAVCAISIIEHFTKQEIVMDFLPEMRRVLKKNGYLLAHMPIRTPFSYLARFMRKYFSRDLPRWAIDDDGDVTHKVWLSFKDYIRIIENAGFEVLSFRFHNTRSNKKPKLLWVIGKMFEKLLNSNYKFETYKGNETKFDNSFKFWLENSMAITGDLLCKKI